MMGKIFQLDSGAAAAAVLPVTHVIPAGIRLHVLTAFASAVTSATVGTRQWSVQVLDPDDEQVADHRVVGTQVASLTRYIQWTQGGISANGAVGLTIRAPLAHLLLSPGWKVILVDDADVDATLDVVRFIVAGIAYGLG